MKKLIYLLVVLVLIAGLSSCKSKKHGVRRDPPGRGGDCNCPTWD